MLNIIFDAIARVYDYCDTICCRRQSSIKVGLQQNNSQIHGPTDNDSDVERDRDITQEESGDYLPHSIPTGYFSYNITKLDDRKILCLYF